MDIRNRWGKKNNEISFSPKKKNGANFLFDRKVAFSIIEHERTCGPEKTNDIKQALP